MISSSLYRNRQSSIRRKGESRSMRSCFLCALCALALKVAPISWHFGLQYIWLCTVRSKAIPQTAQFVLRCHVIPSVLLCLSRIVRAFTLHSGEQNFEFHALGKNSTSQTAHFLNFLLIYVEDYSSSQYFSQALCLHSSHSVFGIISVRQVSHSTV